MEKTVTLRFYWIERSAADRPAFGDLLRLIGALPVAERERRITGEEILVRLEDFVDDGDEIAGQFIRGQSGNRPGRMLRDRTDALPFGEPLAHGVAFRYRVQDGLFAVQFDPRVLSPSRIMSYIYEFDERAEFSMEPHMREDAWDRFDELPVRKLEVAIAGHPNPAGADNADAAVWDNFAEIGERYGANLVRIQVSMGQRKGALEEGIKAFAREAFRRYENGEDDIRAIKGVLETGPGQKNDEVDLMGTLFDVEEQLHFPEDNWARFYTLRRDLLRDRIRRV